jgi:hypothetical protein
MAGVEVKTKTSVGCYRVSMTRARWNTGSIGLSGILGAKGCCAERLEGSPKAESRALLTA